MRKLPRFNTTERTTIVNLYKRVKLYAQKQKLSKVHKFIKMFRNENRIAQKFSTGRSRITSKRFDSRIINIFKSNRFYSAPKMIAVLVAEGKSTPSLPNN